MHPSLDLDDALGVIPLRRLALHQRWFQVNGQRRGSRGFDIQDSLVASAVAANEDCITRHTEAAGAGDAPHDIQDAIEPGIRLARRKLHDALGNAPSLDDGQRERPLRVDP